MDRLVKLWFAFSDMIAWPLLVFSLAGAIAFPFVGPIYSRMVKEPLTVLGIIGVCVLWLVVAAGAYAIVRRRALGLVPVLAPAIALAVSGHTTLATVFAAAWAAVFAAPFVLVLIRARSAVASKSAA